MGLLKGKVAIVTGAGGGLGRAHALALAAEGARVVVNDPGVSRDGSGGGLPMADAVAEEIRAMGGHAVANRDTVSTREGAEAIVRAAIDHFGQLDILINNAGILRDRTIFKMTDPEFDAVMQVHAYGTHLCSHAAAPHLKERGGRIINTSSYAGLIGNFGQSNYAMAKAGIAGYTRVLALELGRYGVTVNAIAPLAKTRMTEDIAAVPEDITPEQIAPFVVFLASEHGAEINGRVFGLHGAQVFEYRTLMTDGIRKEGGAWKPLDFVGRIGEISELPHERAPKAAPSGAAAGEPATTESAQLDALFFGMPRGFRAEKAGDWSTRILFDVKGSGSYTLAVGAGTATVEPGKVGEPKATVTIDTAATILDMARGKVSPEAAFMAGKLKADNLGELMKFGKFFNLAKAAAPQDNAGAAAKLSPEAEIELIFSNMGRAFLAEKAGSWASTLHFDLGSAGAFTVEIKDGNVTSSKGKHGAVKCTITFDSAETLLAMVKGKQAPEQAFMSGKMKADNMGELMKFGQYFDLKRGAAAMASAGGAPAQVAEVAPAGVNPDAVGKVYRGVAHFVRPEEFEAYALATEDKNPRYLTSSPQQIAPPLFVVRPVMKAVENLVMDPEVGADLLRLVHGEQDIQFVRPLSPWELVYPVAIFDRLEKKASGELIYCRQKLWSGGELVAEIVSTYFIRGQSGGSKAPAQASEAAPEREYLFSTTQAVAADQPVRYGHASGDINPIHMDDGVARAAGHPSIILHGLCTMAFVGKAVVDSLLEGDATRLKRLRGRFSRVVLPADVLTIRAWDVGHDGGRRIIGVEATNQKGQTVFANGLAEML